MPRAPAQRVKTISSAKTSKTRLRLIAQDNAAAEEEGLPSRPLSRSECVGTERPCPFVSCRYHLYLDVHPKTQAIKVNRPEVEVDEMTDSCALDVADQGESTLKEVGDMFGVTRERIRQLEGKALVRFKALAGDVMFWHLDEAEEM